jgi:hypothetical protein
VGGLLRTRSNFLDPPPKEEERKIIEEKGKNYRKSKYYTTGIVYPKWLTT